MFWNKSSSLWKIQSEIDRTLIKKLEQLDSKFNLILAHLKLEYIPEKSVTEPAKLVEKKERVDVVLNMLNDMASDLAGFQIGKNQFTTVTTKSPLFVNSVASNYGESKKRKKYVRSGKYSKKNDPRI